MTATGAGSRRPASWYLSFISLLLVFFGQPAAHALVISVVDTNGNPVSGFRWLVEEDNTHAVAPGIPTANSLSVSIHRSNAPIAFTNNGTEAMGSTAGSTAELDLANSRRYIVSVLPRAGYTNGSAYVAVNQDLVTVTVNPLPLPTAQISVLVFRDNNPINSIPDLPQETGLEGFDVIISDALDRVKKDVFGNPLGTTYQQDAGGNFILTADGSPVVAQLGSGIIKTDIRGEALIKYLAPGKYGVQAVSPAGQDWHQTNTIEGTNTIDAWVKAGEPPVFGEFGPPNRHVFIGFVQQFNALPASAVTGQVTGRIVNAHNSRPPNFTFNSGNPLYSCWVGLNQVSSRKGMLAQPCNADSTFTINNVPPGDYQLVKWDTYLNNIFNISSVTVPPAGGTVALGDLPVFRWFGTLESRVFFDRNQNGFRDCFAADGITPSGKPEDCDDPRVDDIGIPEQTVNLRFRDGSMYQSFPTDLTGYVPFDEVFPFMKFLIAEVDYARYKATGATIVADGGGPILPDQGWAYPSHDRLTPQPQCGSMDPATGACINPVINPITGNNLSRTETGPVLLQAMQTFIGMTNVIEWGKAPYAPGENGGISGIVYYATTRAENDPRYAAADPWEPGVPRVQVNLYQDANRDGLIDDLNGNGVTLSDVDNYPFGNFPGVEDIDRNANLLFDAGDAIQIVTTDSWDDNNPTGCQAPPFQVHGVPTQDCFEGLRTFNQVRPGVFDGGYAFVDYHPGGVASGSPAQTLPAGSYIVEAVSPPGFRQVKEEDKNVDFGDAFVPNPLLLPPVCVGNSHVVPAQLSLFPGVAAPFAGQSRPLCDRKKITLNSGQNAAVDFFAFTEVPKAGRIVGLLLNDFANVFDPTHPSYGEKAAPPWLPISIQDFTGREVARAYSDEYGTYNAMVPTTYTKFLPTPTGVSPNMLKVCLNHPGPIHNPDDPKLLITDPRFDPKYSQVCYTFDAWPAKTTYLDTPVLPVAAAAGRTDFPLDCAVASGTPEIYTVSGPSGGPYVAAAGQTITITSAIFAGPVQVPNPAYKAGTGTPLTVPRDYGFGAIPGSVAIGGVPLTNVAWGDVAITATVPAGVQTGELIVTRGDNGKTTTSSITVTVGGPAPIQVPVGGSIQAAIDAAANGALILVPPGTYNELVVMWKNVQLQGWGPYSTFIDATKTPDKLLAWQNKVAGLIASGAVDLIPGQTGLSNLEAGPGILVLAKNGIFGAIPSARIDGFTISGASDGGGILVNGYAQLLQISNNRIQKNRGNYGGGVRLGHPFLPTTSGGFVYADAFNTDIHIHHNQVAANGTVSAAGGGVALFTGSDRYRVTENFICGNFSGRDGGGIGHLGRSDGGLIADNKIVFNQVFQQTAGAGGAGGGILLAGGAPLTTGVGDLSPGSGSVTILSNLLQGNQAGADDGGGIMLRYVNGLDALVSPSSWHKVNIFNNIIVNNISGLAGAVTLQDAINVNIVNNTVAKNDSTATSAAAFVGGPSVSVPHAAGIVSRAHTPALATALGGAAGAYSNPVLTNNIVWHNRSFYWDVAFNNGKGGLLPDVAAGSPPVYSELAVLGTTGKLDPRNGVLTDVTGYDPSNISADPLFVSAYVNGGPGHLLSAEPDGTILTIPAFDEGGNFIDLAFGPMTLTDPVSGALLGDYHLQAISPAVERGNNAILGTSADLSLDFDGGARPSGTNADIGADEYVAIQPLAIPVVLLGTGGTSVTTAPVSGGTTIPVGETTVPVSKEKQEEEKAVSEQEKPEDKKQEEGGRVRRLKR